MLAVEGCIEILSPQEQGMSLIEAGLDETDAHATSRPARPSPPLACHVEQHRRGLVCRSIRRKVGARERLVAFTPEHAACLLNRLSMGFRRHGSVRAD